jgi:hypothetical protein
MLVEFVNSGRNFMDGTIKGAKRVVFEYDLHSEDRDVVVDREGSMPYYEAGDVIERRGKLWRVVQVLCQQAISGPQTTMTLVVSLTAAA